MFGSCMKLARILADKYPHDVTTSSPGPARSDASTQTPDTWFGDSNKAWLSQLQTMLGSHSIPTPPPAPPVPPVPSAPPGNLRKKALNDRAVTKERPDFLTELKQVQARRAVLKDC